MSDIRPVAAPVSEAVARDTHGRRKKLYVPPTLVRWGAVEDLTRNGAGGLTDSGTNMASTSAG